MASTTLFQMFQTLQASPAASTELTEAVQHVREHADLLAKMQIQPHFEFYPEVPADKQDADGLWLESRDFPIETIRVTFGAVRAKDIYMTMVMDDGERKAEHAFWGAKDMWMGLYSWSPEKPGLVYYTSRRDVAGNLPDEDDEPALASLQQRIGIVHSGEFDETKRTLDVQLNGKSAKAYLRRGAQDGWHRMTWSPLGIELHYATQAEQIKHTYMALLAYGAPLVINVKPFERGSGEKRYTYYFLQNCARIFRKQLWMVEHGKMTMAEVLADRSKRIITASDNKKIYREQAKDPEKKDEVKVALSTQTYALIKVISPEKPAGEMVSVEKIINDGRLYLVMDGGRKPFLSEPRAFTDKVIVKGTNKDLFTLDFWARNGKWLVVAR